MAIWDKSRDELYAAANRVLKADGNSFKREKEAFIWALRTFRCEIQEMNREFTSRVLSMLAAQVQKAPCEGQLKLPQSEKGGGRAPSRGRVRRVIV
jgi:hypothetical protein